MSVSLITKQSDVTLTGDRYGQSCAAALSGSASISCATAGSSLATGRKCITARYVQLKDMHVKGNSCSFKIWQQKVVFAHVLIPCGGIGSAISVLCFAAPMLTRTALYPRRRLEMPSMLAHRVRLMLRRVSPPTDKRSRLTCYFADLAQTFTEQPAEVLVGWPAIW